jgi:tellurite resistance protein TehA-like permease
VRRVPFAYDPLYWGLVFPLGMYSVATWQLIETFDLPFLAWISRGGLVVAVAAWLLTFLAMTGRLILVALLTARALRRHAPDGPPPRSTIDQPAAGDLP